MLEFSKRKADIDPIMNYMEKKKNNNNNHVGTSKKKKIFGCKY